MKRFIAITLIFLTLLFSGCLQQKPEDIKDHLVINPLYDASKVPSTMQYLSKGESAQGMLKVKATYNSAYLLKSYSYFEPDSNEIYFFEPKEGYVFLVINTTLENFNEETVMTGGNDFSVADKDGYRFYPIIFYAENPMPLVDALDYSKKFKGEMLIELPASKINIILQYLLAPNYAWQINTNSLTSK